MFFALPVIIELVVSGLPAVRHLAILYSVFHIKITIWGISVDLIGQNLALCQNRRTTNLDKQRGHFSFGQTRDAPMIRPRQPSKPRKPALTADQLAKDLAHNLHIDNVRGKEKGPEEEKSGTGGKKLNSMRAVNTASQALSGVVQSGWKRSSGGSSSKATLNTVVSSASEAAKHLGILRRISPGDIDVERAALSVLGKLIILEMVRCVFLS